MAKPQSDDCCGTEIRAVLPSLQEKLELHVWKASWSIIFFAMYTEDNNGVVQAVLDFDIIEGMLIAFVS